MSFDHLWAGWRASYIGSFGADTPPSATGDGTDGAPATSAGHPLNGAASPAGAAACVFCEIVAAQQPDEESMIVWAGRSVVALLNAYPYASGHLMVMPRRHARELEDLDAAEASELWRAVHDGVAALKSAYRPDGINLGVNLGRAAGAGIPAHLHVHIVPRWLGDTNFMTSVAGVRVLPEPLPVSWQRLHAAWN